jgi:thioredoxin reductase
MTTHDVLIIGGGAAGLNAALVLARARRRVLLVDGGEPRNAPAAHLHGFLSRDGTPPAELLALGRAEVTGYGVEIVDARVTAIRPGFHAGLSDGTTVHARAVLVTTGLTDELPAVAGLRERWGRDVLHCPYCHGYEVRDRPLGVLATGPMAVPKALLVRQWSDDVTLFLHETGDLPADDRARLAARGIQVVAGEVTGVVVEDDRLTGVRLADATTVAREALFVAPFFRANSRLLAALGATIETGPSGSWAAVDGAGRTSVDGVWAAGNVADPMAQLITAAAAGAKAAADINMALVTADVDRALDPLCAA